MAGSEEKYLFSFKKVKILQEIIEIYGNAVKLRETSYLGLNPGDLVTFSYSDSEDRFGLVVRSDRAPGGQFLSTRNNLLFNIFLLREISQPMLDIIVSTLYKDRNRCSYKASNRILGSFFGKNSFRTFNISRASNLIKVDIRK